MNMPGESRNDNVGQGVFNAQKAADILGIPSEYRVVAMTPLGYPDEAPEPRLRKELAEIVSYDKYGST